MVMKFSDGELEKRVAAWYAAVVEMVDGLRKSMRGAERVRAERLEKAYRHAEWLARYLEKIALGLQEERRERQKKLDKTKEPRDNAEGGGNED